MDLGQRDHEQKTALVCLCRFSPVDMSSAQEEIRSDQDGSYKMIIREHRDIRCTCPDGKNVVGAPPGCSLTNSIRFPPFTM